MKTFYQKMNYPKGAYIDKNIYDMIDTESAKKVARSIKKLNPNLSIHIRRKNIVVVKANCKADSYFLACLISIRNKIPNDLKINI